MGDVIDRLGQLRLAFKEIDIQWASSGGHSMVSLDVAYSSFQTTTFTIKKLSESTERLLYPLCNLLNLPPPSRDKTHPDTYPQQIRHYRYNAANTYRNVSNLRTGNNRWVGQTFNLSALAAIDIVLSDMAEQYRLYELALGSINHHLGVSHEETHREFWEKCACDLENYQGLLSGRFHDFAEVIGKYNEQHGIKIDSCYHRISEERLSEDLFQADPTNLLENIARTMNNDETNMLDLAQAFLQLAAPISQLQLPLMEVENGDKTPFGILQKKGHLTTLIAIGRHCLDQVEETLKQKQVLEVTIEEAENFLPQLTLGDGLSP